MNRVLKVVFSRAKGMFVVVSELGRACTKGTLKSVLVAVPIVLVSLSANAKGTLNDATGVAVGLVSVDGSAKALKESSVAVGQSASASTDGAVAVGAGAQATTNDYAIAIGYKAGSSAANSVALGANSYVGSSDISGDVNGVVSVGDSGVAAGHTAFQRRIINVANGVNDNDAATVGQLKSATKFIAFSGTETAAQAEGVASIAIGNAAKAISQDPNTGGAIALGNWSSSAGFTAIAIGQQSNAIGQWALALGTESNANQKSAIGIGIRSQATAEEALALGALSIAAAKGSVALGSNSMATEANTISVGYYYDSDDYLYRRIVNVADGTIADNSKEAVTGGQLYKLYNAEDLTDDNKTAWKEALGVNEGSIAENNQGLVTGGAIYSELNPIKNELKYIAFAGGSLEATATNNGSIAIGNGAKADGESINGFPSISLGQNAASSGSGAIAIGNGWPTAGQPYRAAIANGDSAIALGTWSLAEDFGSLAMGYQAQATKYVSVALGVSAEASDKYSVAIGYDAGVQTATDSDSKKGASVALGSYSVVHKDDVLAGDTYGVISVGNSTEVNWAHPSFNRRIINVADGVKDNDAATFGQLKNAYGIDTAQWSTALGLDNLRVDWTTISSNQVAVEAIQTQAKSAISIGKPSGSTTPLTVEGSNGQWLIDLVMDNQVTENSRNLVSSGTLYSELRPDNGNYISQTNTTAANLSVLDGKVKQNAGAITSLDNRVTAAEVDIGELGGKITTNKTAIDNLGGRVTTVESSVTTNTADISSLKTQVSDNKDSIDSLDGRVTTVESSVTTNTADISSLKTQVSDNKDSIDSLDGRVTTVESSMTTNTADISSLKTQVSDNKDSIDSLDGRVTAAETGISGLGGRVSANESDISELKGKVSDNAGLIADNTKAIETNKNAIAANKAATETNAGKIAVNESKIAENASAIQANTAMIGQNASNIQSLNHRVNKVHDKVKRVGAGAAALAALRPQDFSPEHPISGAVGLGHYDGKQAIAVGMYYRPTENFTVGFGASAAGNDDYMMNAGISYRFGGSGSQLRLSQSDINRKVVDLTDQNRALVAQIESSNIREEASAKRLNRVQKELKAAQKKAEVADQKLDMVMKELAALREEIQKMKQR